MSSEFPNVNAQWSYVLARTLREKGVKQAIICPGARSSPLTFAFAEMDGVEAIPVLDERSAAFFALGLSRKSGRPVVLICTSGTAAANFLPAVIEASESGAGLIVLTADRPPELRQCAVGQTIDQVKLYGGYVRFYQELCIPGNEMGLLRSLRQQVSHAYECSVGSHSGPVHLNLPFRDPLPPMLQDGFAGVLKRGADGFFDHLGEAVQGKRGLDFVLPDSCRADEGIVLIGAHNIADGDLDQWIGNVATFCDRLACPVLADVLNPVRSRADRFDKLVVHYDLILRGTERPEAPKWVVVIGELPTSKLLRQWIEDAEPRMFVFGRGGRNADPTFSKSSMIACDFVETSPEVISLKAGERTDGWVKADEGMRASVDRAFAGVEGLLEPKVAWMLNRMLPEGSALSVSNSMPPRDLEFFGGPTGLGTNVFSSRGANGIDGILSTALGVAHGRGQSYLLTGDLALLHDSNGGLILKELKGDFTIVLINNNGGGIFEMLPVSNFEPVFERYFGTSQDVDFEKWAAVYGIAYGCPDSYEQLETLIREEGAGVRLIEVKVDRKQNASSRKRLLAELSSADL